MNKPAYRQPPLKIVHLIHTVGYGGVETILINWMKALQHRSDVAAHLVCFEDPNGTQQPFVEAVDRAGLSLDFIPWHRGKPVLRSARELTRLLRRFDADILHTHNTYAQLVGWLAARRTNTRLATTLYVWGDFGWKRNLLQRIDQWVLRHYDEVTAQCETTRRDTIARGIDPSRTRVLPSGFPLAGPLPDPGQRLLQRRERGIADDEIILANVARFYPEKAQHTLLRCFRRIHEQAPQTRLWLFGTGPLEPSLRQLTTELGLEESVTFPGFVPHISEELRLVDIQVHPSHAEGVPLAVCSGMEAGLPVVASEVGGIPEVIRDGQNGFLVPAAEDPDFEPAFIRRVLELANDPRLRQRLGMEARHFIETDYSPESAMDKLLETYQDMLRRPQP